MRTIKCVETGELFDSIREAAEKFGLHASNIGSNLQGKTSHCGGYHWEYVELHDKPVKPKSAPSMTIEEVQAEAERRTRETGRYTRYAHIQIEETLRLMKNQTTVHKPKRRAKA